MRSRTNWLIQTIYYPTTLDPETLEEYRKVIPIYEGDNPRAAFDALSQEVRTFEMAGFLRATPIDMKWFKNDMIFKIDVQSYEVNS
jgi:hypothetical protein